ncbi:hypothetical protein QS257_04185 [Terrilactibacillus sp. S3-3]|nr:hypothetical protein QS257_04185 [Terrilactibacillus sp. S3-3]
MMMDKREAVELLKDVLKINTTNPPGNEAALVERLIPVFEKAGILVETIDYCEGRKQLIARYQCSDEGKTLGFSGPWMWCRPAICPGIMIRLQPKKWTAGFTAAVPAT